MDDYTVSLEEANSLRIVRSEPQEASLTFVMEAEEVGRLVWDKSGMRFTGNADASAQVFFDAITSKYNASLPRELT